MKEYKDINGVPLNHGDSVLTISINSSGGDLVKAFFKIDAKGSGYLVRNMDSTFPDYRFYKKSFDQKVFKI